MASINYAASHINDLFQPEMTIGILSEKTVFTTCSHFENKMIYDLRFAQVKGNAESGSNYP